MLSVVMLNVILLIVVILNVVMLNAVMLNVVMLNVVMLSAMAPLKQAYSIHVYGCEGFTCTLNIRQCCNRTIGFVTPQNVYSGNMEKIIFVKT
jgi:hypothetical protein